jgi:hypothetical protein
VPFRFGNAAKPNGSSPVFIGYASTGEKILELTAFAYWIVWCPTPLSRTVARSSVTRGVVPERFARSPQPGSNVLDNPAVPCRLM